MQMQEDVDHLGPDPDLPVARMNRQQERQSPAHPGPRPPCTLTALPSDAPARLIDGAIDLNPTTA